MQKILHTFSWFPVAVVVCDILRVFPTLCCTGDDQEEIEVEVGVFDSEIENIGGDLEQEIGEDTFDEHDSGTESKNETSDEKVILKCNKSL